MGRARNQGEIGAMNEPNNGLKGAKILSLIGMGLFFFGWMIPPRIPILYNFDIGSWTLVGVALMLVFGSYYMRYRNIPQYRGKIK